MRERDVRRMAGLLRARLPELDLEAVPDPRTREGRWSLAQILRATLLGLMARCKSLREAEELTERMSTSARHLLGLPRRLADTTARDALCRVPLDGLRAALHRLVRAAWRRKALSQRTLPIQAVALDGKATALPCLNDHLVQNRLTSEMLASEAVADRTEDVLDNDTTVIRSLTLISADPSWSYGNGKGPAACPDRSGLAGSRPSVAPVTPPC